MTYELYYDINGKVAGVKSELGFHRMGEDNPHWVSFLKDNPSADLSDKQPDPPTADQLQRQADRQAINDYRAKKKLGIATAQDRTAALEAVLNLIGD